MIKNSLEEILDQLSSRRVCFILPHTMPDGDTIGSCLALNRFLNDLGHDATIILDEAIPLELRGLMLEELKTSEEVLSTGKTADLVFCIDFSAVDRLGQSRLALLEKGLTINLDHHKTNHYFCDINVVDTAASATGELIFDLIQLSGVGLKPTYAEPLYAAISSDTGSFKYSNTTAKTHKIIASLLETGFDAGEINRMLYQSTRFQKLKLHAEVMKQMELIHFNQYALVYVSQDMLRSCDADMMDSDGIVESVRDISEIEWVVLLKEIDTQTIKVSMRSKRVIDVAEIANAFSGGGHKHAAGFTLNMSLQDGLKTVRRLMGETL